MENVVINHLAVFLCAVLSLVIGFVWYSPMLFANSWMKAAGLTEEKMKEGKPAVAMIGAFILSVVMAYNLAFFIGSPEIDAMQGLLYGFLTGFGWVALSIAVISLFEMRSLSYILINGGYMVVWFSVTGLILGAWR